MVSITASPITIPTPVVPPAPSAPKGVTKLCPRCSVSLFAGYDEPECLQCGYADYRSTPSGVNRRNKSLIATATKFVLRYAGDSPTLMETLTYVQLKRLRNRVVYSVRCPFCSRSMEQSALSGKRKEVREERYKCGYGHRVSLIPDRTGALGWK